MTTSIILPIIEMSGSAGQIAEEIEMKSLKCTDLETGNECELSFTQVVDIILPYLHYRLAFRLGRRKNSKPVGNCEIIDIINDSASCSFIKRNGFIEWYDDENEIKELVSTIVLTLSTQDDLVYSSKFQSFLLSSIGLMSVVGTENIINCRSTIDKSMPSFSHVQKVRRCADLFLNQILAYFVKFGNNSVYIVSDHLSRSKFKILDIEVPEIFKDFLKLRRDIVDKLKGDNRLFHNEYYIDGCYLSEVFLSSLCENKIGTAADPTPDYFDSLVDNTTPLAKIPINASSEQIHEVLQNIAPTIAQYIIISLSKSNNKEPFEIDELISKLNNRSFMQAYDLPYFFESSGETMMQNPRNKNKKLISAAQLLVEQYFKEVQSLIFNGASIWLSNQGLYELCERRFMRDNDININVKSTTITNEDTTENKPTVSFSHTVKIKKLTAVFTQLIINKALNDNEYNDSGTYDTYVYPTAKIYDTLNNKRVCRELSIQYIDDEDEWRSTCKDIIKNIQCDARFVYVPYKVIHTTYPSTIGAVFEYVVDIDSNNDDNSSSNNTDKPISYSHLLKIKKIANIFKDIMLENANFDCANYCYEVSNISDTLRNKHLCREYDIDYVFDFNERKDLYDEIVQHIETDERFSLLPYRIINDVYVRGEVFECKFVVHIENNADIAINSQNNDKNRRSIESEAVPKYQSYKLPNNEQQTKCTKSVVTETQVDKLIVNQPVTAVSYSEKYISDNRCDGPVSQVKHWRMSDSIIVNKQHVSKSTVESMNNNSNNKNIDNNSNESFPRTSYLRGKMSFSHAMKIKKLVKVFSDIIINNAIHTGEQFEFKISAIYATLQSRKLCDELNIQFSDVDRRDLNYIGKEIIEGIQSDSRFIYNPYKKFSDIESGACFECNYVAPTVRVDESPHVNTDSSTTFATAVVTAVVAEPDKPPVSTQVSTGVQSVYDKQSPQQTIAAVTNSSTEICSNVNKNVSSEWIMSNQQQQQQQLPCATEPTIIMAIPTEIISITQHKTVQKPKLTTSNHTTNSTSSTATNSTKKSAVHYTEYSSIANNLATKFITRLVYKQSIQIFHNLIRDNVKQTLRKYSQQPADSEINSVCNNVFRLLNADKRIKNIANYSQHQHAFVLNNNNTDTVNKTVTRASINIVKSDKLSKQSSKIVPTASKINPSSNNPNVGTTATASITLNNNVLTATIAQVLAITPKETTTRGRTKTETLKAALAITSQIKQENHSVVAPSDKEVRTFELDDEW